MNAITYSDGRTITGPYVKEEFDEALKDQNVVSARIFYPGQEVTMSDRKYRIDNHGSFRRID